MFNIIRKEMEWAGRKLVLETGKIARQADGAVMVTYGETTILATVVFEKKPKQARDFLPLTVHYREMSFAAGKIPGGFFKREGRPSEKETLVSRLIDRPIRPLFPEHFHNEVQVLCTVLSHDLINDPDVVSIVAASAALAISGAPITRTIAGIRVGYIDNNFVLNPTLKDAATSHLDLVVAGTKDSVMMVESEARELTEEQMLEAVELGHNSIKEVIKFIDDFASNVNKTKFAVIANVDHTIDDMVTKFATESLTLAFSEKNKQLRNEKRSEVEEKTLEALVVEDGEVTADKVKKSLSTLEYNVVRNAILDHKRRIDGRKPDEIRQIVSEIDLLHKTHGSALFTRGETQALVVATLGTSQDEQVIDALEGESKSHFMLHYNFPSYSVGEVSPLRSPGRREIGHGKLAWRAMKAVLPEKASFPYTLRLVSEITESNGSSSMATVCGSSLALMDAGVPIKKSVAGIAMGLILDKDRYVILSDIMGDEDHLGDMDFKVAGTKDGITALQMDIKIEGITIDIMKKALAQAKDGREHILGKMDEAIQTPKTSVSVNAPTITTMQINKDKIREVIGSGGKVIRGICEESGAKIEIDDNGTVRVAATNIESRDKALAMISAIVSEAEIGKIYEGKVVKIAEFGAFVNFMGSRDGLVHISELAANRVAKVEEVVKEGDVVKVKVLDVDPKGKIKLSMRVVDQTSGEDISANFPPRANEGSKTERPASEKNTGKRPVRKEAPKEKKESNNDDDNGGGSPAPVRKYYT